MDRFDERILQELTSDGRLSNVELAGRIGLSPSATLRRVQELEKKGVITGYRAVLSREALEIGFIAYVTVGLSNHSKRSQLDFEQRLQHVSEVVEVHNITGGSEYLLRVESRDLKSYKTFHADVLGEIPQVNAITTLVVMGSPKDTRL